MTQQIEKTIIINTIPAVVWKSLTTIDLMKRWMGEPEMNLEIVTNWKTGSPILINGFHHAKFENKGIVLAFEPDKTLRYSHLNSLSRLADQSGNYSIVEFRLKEIENQTLLTLTLSHFPTETIMKHLDFYWSTTLEILKQFVETQNGQ